MAWKNAIFIVVDFAGVGRTGDKIYRPNFDLSSMNEAILPELPFVLVNSIVLVENYTVDTPCMLVTLPVNSPFIGKPPWRRRIAGII